MDKIKVLKRFFRVGMIFGATLMALGLITGWTIAEFHSAVGMPVAAYPPDTRLWEIGVTFLLLGLAGREMPRK